MPVNVYANRNMITVDEISQYGILKLSTVNSNYRILGDEFIIYDGVEKESHNIGLYPNVIGRDAQGNDLIFSSKSELVYYLDGLFSVVDSNTINRTTPPVLIPMHRITNRTELTANAVVGGNTFTVDSAAGAIVGGIIVVFNQASVRFSVSRILGVNGLTLTVDSLIDFNFSSGSVVDLGYSNMKVNGLSTPKIFGIRGSLNPPGLDVAADITRLIFTCTCNTSVNLDRFCNIPALTNGLLFRRRDNGTLINIFNAKSNQDIAGLMFDYVPFDASAQGLDGFSARLTFAGNSKIGTALRLPFGSDIEMIVSDNLTISDGGKSITSFEVVAEGHIVPD